MQLIELRANKESFRTVTFNPEGISIIAAVKETTDSRKTYNSVGKSLTIALIHFCLASSSNPEFEEKLPDWEFYLDFKIKDKHYTSKRSTKEQDKIFLNDEELSLDKFRKKLEEEIFNIPEGAKFISFRGLLSRFIRPSKFSYTNYNKYVKGEDKSITENVNNAFILGLDINKLLKKASLKDSLDKVEQLKKNIDKDDILKSYFQEGNDDDVEIKIVELESVSKKLKNDLDEFRIAEDYAEIKKQADDLALELRKVKNRATKYSMALKNIERSLSIKPDISARKVQNLYKQAELQLSEMVVKKLHDLEKFNKSLLDNRTERLLEDKKRFESHLAEINFKIKKLAKEEDQKLQYLNAHGALEEYTQLNKKLSDTERQLHKLTQYKKLKGEYINKIEKLNKDFIDENINTRKYLEKIKDITDNNILTFKSYVEQFYEGKKCGITISNNDKINKIRFEITAKISDDAGDSVNEVKIFCFDWTVLSAQHNHTMKFLFHDSRILDGMDTRQIRTLFKIANEECKRGFQYIISINQNVIDGLEQEMEDNELEEIIDKNIILQLSDKSDADKLLGVHVDLNYEF